MNPLLKPSVGRGRNRLILGQVLVLVLLEFFLSTVPVCMLCMQDCCEGDNATQRLLLHCCPGRENAAN